MPEARIGIIGGTGLYEMEGMSGVEELDLETPFGKPSSQVLVGRLNGNPVAFISRHGPGHRISPGEVPVRANIWALKSLGVDRVLSISAVGSLKEEIEPSHMVVPDQLIDRTRARPPSFFGEGLVAHVSMAYPYCPTMRQALVQAAQDAGATVHDGGTYVVMEGPQFSTRAESFLYRSWGASVIGMTAMPEAKLAREAELCYATLACATDYDCWHDEYEAVSVDAVIEILRRNVEASKRIIEAMVAHVSRDRDCECAEALRNAIVTAPHVIPPHRREQLALLVSKYLDG